MLKQRLCLKARLNRKELKVNFGSDYQDLKEMIIFLPDSVLNEIEKFASSINSSDRYPVREKQIDYYNDFSQSGAYSTSFWETFRFFYSKFLIFEDLADYSEVYIILEGLLSVLDPFSILIDNCLYNLPDNELKIKQLFTIPIYKIQERFWDNPNQFISINSDYRMNQISCYYKDCMIDSPGTIHYSQADLIKFWQEGVGNNLRKNIDSININELNPKNNKILLLIHGHGSDVLKYINESLKSNYPTFLESIMVWTFNCHSYENINKIANKQKMPLLYIYSFWPKRYTPMAHLVLDELFSGYFLKESDYFLKDNLGLHGGYFSLDWTFYHTVHVIMTLLKIEVLKMSPTIKNNIRGIISKHLKRQLK